MADFPVIADTAVGVTFELTEHTFALPDGIVPGQRLMLLFSMDDDDGLDGTLTMDTSGYDVLIDNEPLGHFGGVVEMKALVVHKITEGDETTVTVLSENAESVAFIGIRMTDFDATAPPEFAGPVTFGTGFDPPSLDPSWDMAAEGALIIAAVFVDPGYAPATGAPSGYENFTEVHIVHNSGAALGIASKDVTTASEDPGAFAFSGSPDVGFFTFAIRPGVDGPGPLNVTFRLSGGAANDDPALSIGGAESSEFLPSALFDDVANVDRLAGKVSYRLVYVHNEDVVDGTATAFISDQLETGRTMAVGVAVEASGEEVDAIVNDTTAPAGVSFSTSESAGTGVDMGTIGAGESRGLWLRRTATASSPVDITNPWEVTVQVTRL